MLTRFASKIVARVFALGVVLISFAVLAQDTTLPSPDGDLTGTAKVILDAVRSKNWALLAAFVVTVIVWGLRKYGGDKIPFFKSKLGGIVLTLAMGAAGAIATALAAGETMTAELLIKGLGIGVTAAGGWAIAKNWLEYRAEQKAVEAGAAAAKNPDDFLNR